MASGGGQGPEDVAFHSEVVDRDPVARSAVVDLDRVGAEGRDALHEVESGHRRRGVELFPELVQARVPCGDDSLHRST